MVAEAATVEAAWVVGPPLLEHLLDGEVSAYCSEMVSFHLYYYEYFFRLFRVSQQQSILQTRRRQNSIRYATIPKTLSH